VTDYEIQVAGLVGPVARSCLPGFTCTLVPRATVLAGTAASTDDLLDVINVLRQHASHTASAPRGGRLMNR
jgi:hypothetical protein